MTLKSSCELGLECGLETVGEALRNVDLHILSLVKYSEINAEIEELNHDIRKFRNNHKDLAMERVKIETALKLLAEDENAEISK